MRNFKLDIVKNFILRSLRLRKPISIAIIDSQFPQKNPLGFRNVEINGILNRDKKSTAFAMYRMKPMADAWFAHGYGVKLKKYVENFKGYISKYPENADRVFYLPNVLNAKICFSYFLAETYTLLPYYEKNNLPFVFVLYPGGAFGLDNESSDAMLKRIFASPCFRGVIVTQPVTRRYLLEKKFIPEEKLHYLFGGYAQMNTDELVDKKFYPSDKNTLDVCFVAFKYSPMGKDKGYDIFIESAKILAREFPFVRFHVVGNFDESDIDVADIKEKITFHGVQPKEFLLNFYSRMDICISPNRLGGLYKGNFDGFPLSGEALFCGCALMTTDELNNNEIFNDGEDIIIIKPDTDDVVKKAKALINDVKNLYSISKNGQRICTAIPPDQRVDMTLSIINSIIERKE